MQSGNASGSGGGVKAEINVTPLVDVCLVLLIIFMVVTPMLVNKVEVQLPETKQPEKMPELGKQLSIGIKSDGTIYLEKDWVPTKEKLQEALVHIHQETPEKTVVIRADRSLKYRQVREVMKLVNEAGFPGVGLVTNKKAQG